MHEGAVQRRCISRLPLLDSPDQTGRLAKPLDGPVYIDEVGGCRRGGPRRLKERRKARSRRLHPGAGGPGLYGIALVS